MANGSRDEAAAGGLPQNEVLMAPFPARGATPSRPTSRFGFKGQPRHFAEFVKPLRKSGSAAIAFFPGAKPNAGIKRNRGLDPVLGRLGSLEVRLATTAKEIRRAQRLRFQVFYDEMSAVPSAASLLARRDFDEYDAI
jgi:hypothetical protein